MSTDLDRFMALTTTDPECWLWTGYKSTRGAYGAFSVQTGSTRRTVAAHRWAYEHFVGPIPAGMFLDHLCGVPPCVNPAHLEPVTDAENKRRAELRRSECKRGHVRDESNVYTAKDGKNSCRACHRENEARYRREGKRK